MSDADNLTEVKPDSIEDQDNDLIEDLDFSPPLDASVQEWCWKGLG